MSSKQDISINFRIWFHAKDEKLVGKGRVQLLELIQETGSISHAAKMMKMSYRQAWQMVQEMNERSGSPLVEKKLGGKSGGGSVVTKKGERLILAFHETVKRVDIFLREEITKLDI